MQVQKRSEIEEKYKWKLEDIFASDADWEAEFAQAEALLPQLEAQKEWHYARYTEYAGWIKADRSGFIAAGAPVCLCAYAAG